MARTKISEFSATAADNTDIDNIDIAEGCAPSGINNAIRELMAQLKDFQTGAAGDPFNGAVNGTVGATTPAAGKFTTLEATSAATFAAGTVTVPTITTTGDANTGIFFPAADSIAFTVGGVECARMTADADLLVGTTSNSPTISHRQYIVQANNVLGIDASGGGTAENIRFYNAGTAVGTIQTNATATIYNTSSDYRLKENVQPMTGALEKVAQLKPVTYTWKVNGSAGQGFIAHELQAVVPDCVTGEKDAIDNKGNPQYQGIDTSFLVATLTAAIQELKAEFDAYKASHP